MIRVLFYLALTILLALAATWLAAHPGTLVFTWLGYRVEMSVFLAVAALLALAVTISLLWGLVRYVFRLPRAMSLANRMRKRNKGYEALSRGLIAVGVGDVRAARREASEAGRLIGHEPMTLLLKAQAAQLAGDRATAESLFSEMAGRPETKALGLRGLYVEARRRGDEQAALRHAEEAQKLAPAPWSGEALLEHRATTGDWAGALATLERNAAAGHVDKPTLERQRAALKTGIALEKAEREPDAALALAREALASQPDLVPAAALAARLYGRRGDLKKGARAIEDIWPSAPHPDLARAYVDLRPGDSAADRLERARRLARLAPDHVESRLALAAAAIGAQRFDDARAALAPLVDDAGPRPSLRVCLAMAELEEASGGPPGRAREWYARASRAPREAAWVADGVISETWAPASPLSGEIGAFQWRTPDERLAPPIDLPARAFEPVTIEAAPLAIEAKPEGSARPVEAKPVEAKATEAKATETKSAGNKTVEAKPVDAKPGDSKPADSKPAGPPAKDEKGPQPVVFPLDKAPDDPGVKANSE